jgi:peptidyl-prolyl cis-trans isomerase SurA
MELWGNEGVNKFGQTRRTLNTGHCFSFPVLWARGSFDYRKAEGIPMKKLFWVIPLILFSLRGAEARTVDRILAQVNDDIITMSELNQEMAPYRKQLASKYSGEELEQAIQKTEKQVLDELIQEKLLYQKAMELGFNADIEPQVSAAIQRIIKENNLKDTDDLEKALEQQGQTVKDLREYYRKKIISDSLVDYFVSSRITLLTPEIEKYYKDHLPEFSTPAEVTLSSIEIPIKEDAKEAEERANDVYRKLQQGESFPTLASQYSSGPTASKGGSIGTYQVSKLNADTLNATATLKEGEVSKPQREKDTFVIYRVDSRKLSVVRPLEEVRDYIKNQLYQQKFTPELERYVSQLKEDAYIQYFSEIK